jgi:hypothetical protein
MTDELFIYCDAVAHKGRRVKVAKFYRVPHGQERRPGWSEHPGVPLLTSGVQLVGDDLPTADAPLMDGLDAGTARWRPRLECRRCRVPLVAREERLFAALDAIIEAGESSQSLSDLRASVERIST